MNPLTLLRSLSILQRIGVGLGVIIALIAAWKLFWWQHDSAVIEQHETEIAAQVIEASATASVAAVEAATDKRNEVEHGNDNARRAARNSGDPLRDGLNSLRTGAR